MTETDEMFLITGATGNTGAHTVKLLRERATRSQFDTSGSPRR